MNMGWHRLIHHRTRENYSSGGARERGGGRAKSQNLCASTAPLVLSSHQRCCFLTAKSTSDSAAFVSLSVQLMCATLNMHLPVSAHILSCLSATWRDEARPGSSGSWIHRISYPIFSPLFIQTIPFSREACREFPSHHLLGIRKRCTPRQFHISRHNLSQTQSFMTHKQQQTWLFNEILRAASWKMLEKHHFCLFVWFVNNIHVFSWNVKELPLNFTCKPSEIPICCLFLCWALLLAQDASVTGSSVHCANLLKHHAMCFSFCNCMHVICFWSLMQDKCMQSSIFSCFCVYSKDRVEVRVCLLAAFVCLCVVSSDSLQLCEDCCNGVSTAYWFRDEQTMSLWDYSRDGKLDVIL